MIEARQKEFEDGLFEIELLKNQQGSKGTTKIAEERRTFAGLIIGEDELDEVGNMSLKEYLAKRDQRNFRLANGQEEVVLDQSKKRKHGEISKEEDEDEVMAGGHKPKKVLTSGTAGGAFLDVGSISWSLLLACFFLQLHDDRKTYYLIFDSMKEMLGVLKEEFKDFVPFETD